MKTEQEEEEEGEEEITPAPAPAPAELTELIVETKMLFYQVLQVRWTYRWVVPVAHYSRLQDLDNVSECVSESVNQ